MSEQGSRSDSQELRKARSRQLQWLFAAYQISRESIAKVPLASCAPVTWDVARGVDMVLHHLDALEEHKVELAAVLETWAFRQSRLFVAALGHVNRLHRRAQDFALEGTALWRSAHAARLAMRKLVAAMDADGFIVEGMTVPRRRGNSARSVGNELLELVQFGKQNDLCLEQYDRDLPATLHDARLQAELLLTAIGDRDAASVVREVHETYLRACTLFMWEWRGLRALLRMHGYPQHQVERLAPALGSDWPPL